MKRKKRPSPLGERAEQLLDLPAGSLTAAPRIELTGDRQMLIENGCRLRVCEEDRIGMETACGTLWVRGGRLCLTVLSADSLTVCGHILSVEYAE